jgi:hypothetical protein
VTMPPRTLRPACGIGRSPRRAGTQRRCRRSRDGDRRLCQATSGVPAPAVVVAGALVRGYGRPPARRGPTPGPGPFSSGTRCPAGAIRIDVPAALIRAPRPVRPARSGSRFVPPLEAPKRVLRRSTTRCVSWANVVEVQVDLDGGIQSKTAPCLGSCW